MATVTGVETFRPAHPTGTGVLVLAGSSGRVDTQRAMLLAKHGAVALPLQWFGGHGQSPGPWEVPIETFISALDHLAKEADSLAIVGVSFGAEAALITASLDPRVRAVAAFAPSHVVWAGYDQSKQRWTSHWSWQGRQLPFVPIRRPSVAAPGQGPPSYLPVYQASLNAATAEELEQATICVENIPEVLLVSGGDDQVWPSADFARHQEPARVPRSRHRPRAPGRGRTPHRPPRGTGTCRRTNYDPRSTLEADSALGQLAWPHLLTTLRLD